MTYGLVSDIHANLTAFEAVLDRLSGVDKFICPGDIVGYGPEPAECLSRLRSLDCATVLGNHDAAVCGMLDAGWFNPDARAAVSWTQKALSETEVHALSILPLTHEAGEFVVVHGSLAQPGEFRYIFSPAEARQCFEEMTPPQPSPAGEGASGCSPSSQEGVGGRSVCFVGHSHVCEVYSQEGYAAGIDPLPGSEGRAEPAFPQHIPFGVDQIEMPNGGKLDLRPGLRYIVNCGSVGQPRDGNPDAGCAIFDSEAMTVEIIRVPYDISAVQNRMRRARLPRMLIDRLEYGL